MQQAKRILDQVGIGGERLEMFNLSAAQGQQFAEMATEMSERAKRLGPNPLRLRRQKTAKVDEATVGTRSEA